MSGRSKPPKMKLQLFHIYPSLATLALLLFPLGGLTLPYHPATYLPTLESPDWEAALLQLQAWLGAPGTGGLQPWGLMRDPGETGPEELLARLQGVETQLGWGPTGVLRGQREELDRRPLGPFPQHPMETVHYQQGGEHEGEGGEKRNEALTSIAGGLQAFNRQKGGFGFRFGRK